MVKTKSESEIGIAQDYLDERNRIREQLHSNMLIAIIWRALVNLFFDKIKSR